MLCLVVGMGTGAGHRDREAALYWPWAQDKLDRGLAKSFYARTGRGAVALFDVDSNEVLHGLLNEWAEIIPAEVDIFPLIDPDAIKSFLATEPEV